MNVSVLNALVYFYLRNIHKLVKLLKCLSSHCLIKHLRTEMNKILVIYQDITNKRIDYETAFTNTDVPYANV